MKTYIGIDLGTSSVKLLLVDTDGNILAEATESYSVAYPNYGWSEQNPQDWITGTKAALTKLLDGQDRAAVKGISFGGQMHGLVVLDKEDNVIRPCILWNDGRTEIQTAYLNEIIGKDKLSEYTANIAFAGFTAPKILWLKKNEPHNYARIAKIMLPKDYLAYMLTGVHSTDYSDASGTLLLDVKNKCWSKEMCDICGIEQEYLPKLYESYEVIGTLKQRIAQEFGLNNDVIITAGAGDNAAAAIGTGTVGKSSCNISIGTSGTIFVSSYCFTPDKNGAIHSFCHADGKYHQMGCILSAASCTKWWMDNIIKSADYDFEQIGMEEHLGKNEVMFLPYMMGERSPHNDVNAQSVFIGMRPDTTRMEMLLAIFEGVAFAMRDCIEQIKQNGISITTSKICGGGAKSKIWQQIFANVLGVEIQTLKTEQGPGYGAAILAMVGNREFETVDKAVSKIITTAQIISPNAIISSAYAKKYEKYKQLYPAIKNIAY